MRKDDNDWEITVYKNCPNNVEINGTHYEVEDKTACITHAILLLVDAINDKKVN